MHTLVWTLWGGFGPWGECRRLPELAEIEIPEKGGYPSFLLRPIPLTRLLLCTAPGDSLGSKHLQLSNWGLGPVGVEAMLQSRRKSLRDQTGIEG